MIKDRIWTLVSRKLSGEATSSELTELDNLVKTQANTSLYLQAIDEFWKIPVEKDEEFLEATYHLHLNRLKERGFDLETDKEKDESPGFYFDDDKDSPARSNWKRLLITGSLLLIFISFFLINHYKNQIIEAAAEKVTLSEVSTKSGSRTRIQLPDSSSVWLNGGSKLVYDNRHFGEKIREVTLTGEAYFDIAKNKDKPFIIHANKIDIRVMGTIFNVRAYPGEKNTETSLIRGTIEITLKDRKEKIILKTNDKLTVSNEEMPGEKSTINSKGAAQVLPGSKDRVISLGHLTLASDDNTIIETAWVENKLVFDKETFEDVALKMERWYGVSIKFANNKLKSQRLTGTFEKETIMEALRALQLSTPFFKYKINNQIINIF